MKRHALASKTIRTVQTSASIVSCKHGWLLGSNSKISRSHYIVIDSSPKTILLFAHVTINAEQIGAVLQIFDTGRIVIVVSLCICPLHFTLLDKHVWLLLAPSILDLKLAFVLRLEKLRRIQHICKHIVVARLKGILLGQELVLMKLIGHRVLLRRSQVLVQKVPVDRQGHLLSLGPNLLVELVLRHYHVKRVAFVSRVS